MSLENFGFWRALWYFFFAPLCIGGSSSSKSSQEYNTYDNRVAGGASGSQTLGQNAKSISAAAGGIALETTGSTVTIHESSAENFSRLLDSLDRQDALNGKSLNSLLSGVEKVVAISATQVETSKSTLDNKTLSLFAVAGVVVAAMAFKFG